MVKFIVVMKRRSDMTKEEFRRFFDEVHAPLARRIPELMRYVRNFPVDDPTRRPPAWDAVVEFHFADRDALERAWASPEGVAGTNDLANLADPEATTWSVVEQVVG